MSTFRVVRADMRRVLRYMASESVDAIVTDPPYELGFMGKRWDRAGIAFDPTTWAAGLRVLKPGGRLLAFGAPRKAHRIWCAIEDAGFVIEDTVAWMFGSGFPKHASKLKPAYEPVVWARKGPVSALNIDAGRIAGIKGVPSSPRKNANGGDAGGVYGRFEAPPTDTAGWDPNAGRWPPNVALDEIAARALDEMSGELSSGQMRAGTVRSARSVCYGEMPDTATLQDTPGDSGGASRFFYCAKSSRAERETGLEDHALTPGGSNAKGFTDDVARGLDRNRPVANPHPTVKPVALMRWLVRLVTQPGDLVLDPFAGSGTTGIACMLEGRRFVGVEMDAAYAEIARKRIAAWKRYAVPDEPKAEACPDTLDLFKDTEAA